MQVPDSDLTSYLPAYRKPYASGATWNAKKNKWIAQIQVHGKNMHLGNFATEEQARAAYMEAGGRERFEKQNPGSRSVPVGNSHFAIVDSEDFEWLCQWKWKFKSYLDGKYACRPVRINGKTSYVQMHREITKAPDDTDVDHRDRNGLNNRKVNLRIGTHQQNMCNREKERCNTSGFKGVSWDKKAGKWVAQIRCKNKQYNLGHYDTPEEGASAYQKAANELHGEFARY